MSKFRPKEIDIIDAEQFNPPSEIPKCVLNYHILSEKQDLYSGVILDVNNEQIKILKGDWIVKEPDSTGFYSMSNEIFTRKYEPVPN